MAAPQFFGGLSPLGSFVSYINAACGCVGLRQPELKIYITEEEWAAHNAPQRNFSIFGSGSEQMKRPRMSGMLGAYN